MPWYFKRAPETLSEKLLQKGRPSPSSVVTPPQPNFLLSSLCDHLRNSHSLQSPWEEIWYDFIPSAPSAESCSVMGRKANPARQLHRSRFQLWNLAPPSCQHQTDERFQFHLHFFMDYLFSFLLRIKSHKVRERLRCIKRERRLWKKRGRRQRRRSYYRL